METAWPRVALEAFDKFSRGDGLRSVYAEILGSPRSAYNNSDQKLPAASLAKLVIVSAALDWDHGAHLNDEIQASMLPITDYPSIIQALDSRRRITLREACAFSIMTSDNPCASFILDHLGPERVNQYTKSMQLASTHIIHGFSDEWLGPHGRANQTCSTDMANLIKSVYAKRAQAPLLWKWLANSLRNNRIPARLPDELEIANKTGSLAGVANEVAIINGKQPLLICVLTDQQTDTNETSQEMGIMAEVAYYSTNGS